MLSSSLKVGLFLAVRQVRRTNFWTNALIVFIMTLTFMNLVVVSGILVGLVEGSSNAYRAQYSADVLITSLRKDKYIESTPQLLATIRALPSAQAFTARYIAAARVEASYQTRVGQNDEPNQVGLRLIGIDPIAENAVTNLSRLVVEGKYLEPDETGYILIGSSFLRQYNRGLADEGQILDNVYPGAKVRVAIGDVFKEYIVKGIVKSKIQAVGLRAYVVDSELRKILNRTDLGVNEIAVKLERGISPEAVASELKRSGFESKASIRSWAESQGTFFDDLRTTFVMLGNVIGAIGLFIASITIFIVIFINAINRKRYIGILKATGVSAAAIEISYMAQSFVYALSGAIIGFLLTHGLLQPYFVTHPIDFPFSDGILVVPLLETGTRIAVLVIITIVAGFIPARIVVSKKTLDAILNR